MIREPIDEQKWLEVERPVSAKKSKELDEQLKTMEEIAKRHKHDISVSEFRGSTSLQVGMKLFTRNNGKWVQETKTRNPQYNPNKIKYGNAWCNLGEEIQIIIFSYPLGITNFHGKMMKLFKRLGWKYTSQLQVEGCEDSMWNTKKFPKYSIAMDGTIKKVSP